MTEYDIVDNGTFKIEKCFRISTQVQMEISLKTKYLMTEICIDNKSMANQEFWAGGRRAEGCTFSSFQCILSVRANLLKCLVIQLVQQVN